MFCSATVGTNAESGCFWNTREAHYKSLLYYVRVRPRFFVWRERAVQDLVQCKNEQPNLSYEAGSHMKLTVHRYFTTRGYDAEFSFGIHEQYGIWCRAKTNERSYRVKLGHS